VTESPCNWPRKGRRWAGGFPTSRKRQADEKIEGAARKRRIKPKEAETSNTLKYRPKFPKGARAVVLPKAKKIWLFVRESMWRKKKNALS